jgi:glucose-6-phosphate 1-epimerase
MQGAHITQWIPSGQKPVLFTSTRSEFVPGKAIRGGVPIIFPWFGPREAGLAGPSHGFARTALWRLVEVQESNGGVETRFELEARDVVEVFGVGGWRLNYGVVVGRRLQMDLQVSNLGDAVLTFEEALHSYFAVSDIAQVSVEGLDGIAYIDKVDGGTRKMEKSDAIRLIGETDRVYLDTEVRCVVNDAGWKRRVVVEKRGSRSTVVWNPWSEKAKGLRDLGEEWREMVCVESANVAENAIRLQPGGTHVMSVVISVD